MDSATVTPRPMRFTYSCELPDQDPRTVFDWHERPGALERLTPPWGELAVLRRSGGIRDGGEVELKVRRGPTSFHWQLRHLDYVHGEQFRDEQISGPLKSWSHTHRFKERDGGGTVLEDEIDLDAPLGAAGAAIGPLFLKTELGRLFRFRYRRLFTDLARHAEHASRPRLTVAISGASGFIGRSLQHFLTTGGHKVIRMVRDSREVGDDAIYWNPTTGEIDKEGLAGADAVVGLAGTPMAPGRWTDDRKRSIRNSRVQGTQLLARTLAELPGGPRTFVSMSAVGYYGDRGSETLGESAKPGRGFLADVCREWEAAAQPAEQAGVRVVTLRAGPLLSPAGGPVGEMLVPFKLGLGGRIGSGKQYLSWIDPDDLVAAVYHTLYTDSLRGPVNATAPHPVPNSTFASALGRALGRPTVIPVPSLAVKALFGQLGTEVLLWGSRVIPRKLLDSGFRFFYEGIDDCLRFELGREPD